VTGRLSETFFAGEGLRVSAFGAWVNERGGARTESGVTMMMAGLGFDGGGGVAQQRRADMQCRAV
jgi:hypothetical protein